MKISALDIRHKQFGRAMFGLNEEEVIEFLQSVANEMESLVQERNNMRDSLREKDLAITEMRERDRVLQTTIQTAGQMAERIRTDAEREVKLILADAQQKAEIITRDSRDSLKKIYQEISDLKRSRMQFEASVRGLAQAHLTLLDQGDKMIAGFGMPQMHFENTQTRSTEISPLASNNLPSNQG